MNVFDIIVIILIGIFVIKGFKNGLVKELGSLIALITGVFISIRFSSFIESLLKDKGGFSSEYLPLISYAITFIAVVILVILFAKLLDQFVKLIKLGWLNKLAGVVFSFLKITIILGGIFFFFISLNEKMNIVPQEQLAKSILFYPILYVFEFIFPYVEKLASFG